MSVDFVLRLVNILMFNMEKPEPELISVIYDCFIFLKTNNDTDVGTYPILIEMALLIIQKINVKFAFPSKEVMYYTKKNRCLICNKNISDHMYKHKSIFTNLIKHTFDVLKKYHNKEIPILSKEDIFLFLEKGNMYDYYDNKMKQFMKNEASTQTITDKFQLLKNEASTQTEIDPF